MGQLPVRKSKIDIDKAREILDREWAAISSEKGGFASGPEAAPHDVAEAIYRSINSETLTCRYVLPTQVLAKLATPEVDCRAVQAGAALPGAFDARSVCHKVVVPFDRKNDNVLGGSAEPYLNNPIRIPAITSEFLKAQKNKGGFGDLIKVLEYVERYPDRAPAVFRCILRAIRGRMEGVSISYPGCMAVNA